MEEATLSPGGSDALREERKRKRKSEDEDAKEGEKDSASPKPPYKGGPIESANGWVLFVTGLSPEANSEGLAKKFGTSPILNLDRKSGKCKGYALMEYKARTEAQDAINKLHGTELFGQTIGVHWAFAKQPPNEES